MPTTKDHFRVELEGLVHRFEANLAEYMSPGYTEAQVRGQFIDPFFAALGWDLADKAGLGPNRCEVWTEKGETSGKPDYNFRIDGQTKFFVEAKEHGAPASRIDKNRERIAALSRGMTGLALQRPKATCVPLTAMSS